MIESFPDNNSLSFQERFKQIAELNPNQPAVIDGSLNKSYEMLDEESRKVSIFLRGHGVGANDLVIVYMTSSYEYVCACLAILKAGAAFLPVPVDHPISQLELIFADACPKVILAQPQYLAKLNEVQASASAEILSINPELLIGKDSQFNAQIIQFEAELSQAGQNLEYTKSAPNDYAFATYTSGTTGKPKGVLQIQAALLASYDARHRFNPYQGQERVACNVFFMWEILRPLLVGGTTVVIPDALLAMPKKLANFLFDHNVTEVLFTPSAFQRLIRSVPAAELRTQLAGLRTIWLNGEVVTTKLVKEALETIPSHIKLLNTYSICECHDVSNADLRSLNYTDIEKQNEGICPVGYADQGVIVKVKDDVGLHNTGKGELYISGHGLGPGYLHLEKLTAERFPTVDGQRYYATGDLAELSSDGLITIKGRLGTMVKMRGYSVYLNSIEEALRLHPDIQDARVFLRGDHLSQHLSAFIIGPQAQLSSWLNETQQSAPRLREWLTKHLAPYMIPSKWIRLDYFPVHPISGKLDQQSLWDLEIDHTQSLESLSEAPQSTWDECISLMKSLWARSLEVDLESIHPHADFYDLGGHSLSMVDLVTSVEQVFGLKLDGDELYERPKLEDYLAYILKDRFTSEVLSTITKPESLTTIDSSSSHVFWIEADLNINWPSLSLLHKSTAATRTPQATKRLLSESKTILLTGATGHLGLGLLEALLTKTQQQTQIICLVRPSEQNGVNISGEQRLITRYQEALLGDLALPIKNQRLSVIEGDIGQDKLGLNTEVYHQLCASVDVVYHCAAFVNLRAQYDQMKQSIVIGSKNILHFCAQTKLKTLHYISTNSVALGEANTMILEEFVSDQAAQKLKDGYSQAKWVAESLMQQAINDGLNVTIYRPGNIGPHQTTGYLNPNDLSVLIWHACKRQKQAPMNTNWLFELTPVNLMARLILSLSDQSQGQRIYHLVHPHPIRANELFESWSKNDWLEATHDDWQLWRQILLASENSEDKVLGASLAYFNTLLLDEQKFSIENVYTDLPYEAKIYDQSPELEVFFQKFFNEHFHSMPTTNKGK